MTRTELVMTTGETLTVGGSPEDVAKQLEDATRSTAGTFAWLHEAAGDELVGIKPAHVVSIRPARN